MKIHSSLLLLWMVEFEPTTQTKTWSVDDAILLSEEFQLGINPFDHSLAKVITNSVLIPKLSLTTI